VQNYEGAVKGTPDCAPVAATIMLGPSTMEEGGARILAAFDPCVLTDVTVLSPEVQLDSQDIEEDRAINYIEQEIECQTLIDRHISVKNGVITCNEIVPHYCK
jgi:hypothetical protein